MPILANFAIGIQTVLHPKKFTSNVGTCRGMSAHQALHLRVLLKANMPRHVPT